jgi:large subunit ribosomal protein L30
LLCKEESQWIKYLTDNIIRMDKIKIKQVRSRIGRPKDQKLTLDALGLRKMNAIVEHNATPQILGMVKKVSHLVTVVE